MSQNNKRTVNREDEEIELMDYLIVLWKRKWLILAGTLTCTIVAGIVAFNMSKIYEVSILFSVGSDEWGIKAGSELLKHARAINKNNVIVKWKDSKAVFARTIPRDKYVFLETEKRIVIEPPPPRLMIARYSLTYYFDEISGILKIWAEGGEGVRGKLTINDDLLVLIGNTIVIEKVMGSGRGIMPFIYSIPFSSRNEDLDFLKIIYVESNGAVHLICKGNRLILEPEEQYEMSYREDQAIHTVTIKNHGLLDKEKIAVQ